MLDGFAYAEPDEIMTNYDLWCPCFERNVDGSRIDIWDDNRSWLEGHCDIVNELPESWYEPITFTDFTQNADANQPNILIFVNDDLEWDTTWTESIPDVDNL
eukprot:UN23995